MKLSITKTRTIHLIILSLIGNATLANEGDFWKPMTIRSPYRIESNPEKRKNESTQKYQIDKTKKKRSTSKENIKQRKTLKQDNKQIDYEFRNNIPFVKEEKNKKVYSLTTRTRKKSNIKWSTVSTQYNKADESVNWKVVTSTEQASNKKIIVKERAIPSTMQESDTLYGLIKPQKEDFGTPLRIGPTFPTANQLEWGDSNLKVYTLSTFSGGEAGGTGNQNYAFRLDYGLTSDLQLSGFYSVADDPLYSKLKSNTSSTPNYWESYGAAFKYSILKTDALRFSFTGSVESWNVKSGNPNMFNSSDNEVSNKNLVGSIAIPLSWQLSQDFQLSFTPGVSFLPSDQGEKDFRDGEFYGTNYYFGTGFIWKANSNLSFLSSVSYPIGPGNNNFDSSLVFSRVPIYNFGINWDINPRIGIEGMLTNSFGATPATGILTIPSEDKLGYYAGFRYTPWGIDSPQRPFSPREKSLANGGLTVNTALVPPRGDTQVWVNADNEGNVFGYIGHSLSNVFQLDVINIGSFNDVSSRGESRGVLVDRYTNDVGLNTRVGGKFVIFSPLRNSPIWTATRISAGRNQDSRQGYLFTELINTWEISDKLAINFVPKFAWNGYSTPKGLGLGANLQLSKRFQLIPEYNLVDNKNGDSNGTLAIRWLFNDDITLDLYASSAAGLQDMGQLIGSDSTRLGMRFNINY